MQGQSGNNEQYLLLRMKEGDESAFATIYSQYASTLVSFAAARLSSLDEARDIIHDLFVQVWEARNDLVITHSLQSFLFAATRYRIIDHIRKNKTRSRYAEMIMRLGEVADVDPLGKLDAQDLEESIMYGLMELSPRVREVYLLSREQHFTVSEISEQLNISPQTVKNQLTTALSHLRSYLKKLSVFLIGW